MKGIVLLISIVLFVSTVCQAQITVGPRVGLNVADIKEFGLPFSGGADFFNPKISYHAGAFIQIPTSEKVFLLGELIYSRKGSRLRDQNGNRFNFQLNYLSLPALIGIQINDWAVIFGTELGLKVGESRLNSRVDVGLVGGLKYYTSDRTQLGLRFIQGLTSLNNVGIADGGNITGLNKLKNQTWQISLTYDFQKF